MLRLGGCIKDSYLMNKLIYIFILIVLVSCHNEEVQNIGNEVEQLIEENNVASNKKDTISKISNCITDLEKITDTIYYDLIKFYNIKNYQLFKIVAIKMKPIHIVYKGFVVKKKDKVIDCVYIITESEDTNLFLIRGKMEYNHKMPLDVELFGFDTLDLKADDNFYQAFVIDLKRYKLFDTIFKPYPVDSSRINKYYLQNRPPEFSNPHEIDWGEFRAKQKDSLSIYYKKRNERIIQEKRKDSIEFYNKRDSLKNW